MTCNGQCHGCAYRPGAAANRESHNKLRAVFAALGGYPFLCHESLGWTPDRPGYPDARALNERLGILMTRAKLVELGAMPENIARETEQLRRSVRMCFGWRTAVARLKAAGWFARADFTAYRRQMGKLAARALDDFIAIGKLRPRDWRDELHPENPLATAKTLAEAKMRARADLKMYTEFFVTDARESGVNIRWLMD